MRIALDAQLTIGTATGIGEYTRGLASALAAEGADVIELSEPKLDPWRFDRRVIWDQLRLPGRTRDSDADVLHCTSGTMPFFRPTDVKTNRAIPIVVTVHDVAWLRVQAHAKWYARYYFGNFALAQYRCATRIVVDSEFSRSELSDVFTRSELKAHIPPIDVVYPGVSEDFCTLVRSPAGSGVILVVGTVEHRKNLELLLRVLPSLPDARIISVGPFTPYANTCRALAAQLGVADRVEMRGYIPRDELLRLYATCAVVAIPSRYEGFGYAAAQALCAGTPAIVSDQSSLPEVAGEDAAIVPIGDDTAWAAALRAALDGKFDVRAHESRIRSIQRFAWQTSARRMLLLYQKARY